MIEKDKLSMVTKLSLQKYGWGYKDGWGYKVDSAGIPVSSELTTPLLNPSPCFFLPFCLFTGACKKTLTKKVNS